MLMKLFVKCFVLSSVVDLFNVPTRNSVINGVVIGLVDTIVSDTFVLNCVGGLFRAVSKRRPRFSTCKRRSHGVFACLVTDVVVKVTITVKVFLLVIPNVCLTVHLRFCSTCVMRRSYKVVRSLRGD